jgi:hypothetical protein
VSLKYRILEKGNARDTWQMLKRMRGGSFTTNSITEREWMDHFSKVLGGEQCEDNIFYVPYSRTDENFDKPFTAFELQTAIDSLKNNKAAGSDGIPGEIYKLAANEPYIFQTWLDCFNAMFAEGKYYEPWNLSIIHTIYKNKGSKDSPDNYRGVALAPILSKVYSRLLFYRLQPWAIENNKISPYQADFRPGYSTVDNIFIMDHLIKKYLSMRKGKLYCAFVDFQKAFDTVIRSKLWLQLWQLGCSSKMLHALMALYNCVQFSIKYGINGITEPVGSFLGVKQGCILSPLLFVLFINNIIDVNDVEGLDAPRIGLHDEIPVPGLLFADDLVLCSTSNMGLQESLRRLEAFSNATGLQVHPGKSKIICFKNGTTLGRLDRFTFKGQELETVRSITYLGVAFSMTGKWSKHIKLAAAKAKKQPF